MIEVTFLATLVRMYAGFRRAQRKALSPDIQIAALNAKAKVFLKREKSTLRYLKVTCQVGGKIKKKGKFCQRIGGRVHGDAGCGPLLYCRVYCKDK